MECVSGVGCGSMVSLSGADEESIMFEIVADYACETGEGPLWHSDEQALYV